ncbi:MAG TPA: hypothetical protein VE967_06205 [Gemmatimonadaceae bacterium]|nr:hypothetical protein [Gemmatimonadaceae bacterium]
MQATRARWKQGHGFALVRHALLLSAAVVVTATCGDNSIVGSRAGVHRSRPIALSPVFSGNLALVGQSGVAFNRVRVIVERANHTIAFDKIFEFPANADELPLSLDIPLSDNSGADGEAMTLTMQYLDDANTVVFVGGPINVQVVPANSSTEPPPPVEVPIHYTGPGANAAKVVLQPKTTTLFAGNPITLTALAFDADGAQLAGTPIVFTVADETVLQLSSNGHGAAQSKRGTTAVIAHLLTGPADTGSVTVILGPSAIAPAGGNTQSGTVGSALGQPVAVVVTASDNLPVPDATVTFTASGGGAAGTAVVQTDATGRAQTTWKLGTVSGAQTMTATVAGLTTTSAVFTATAVPAAPATLAFTQQVTGSVAAGTTVTVTVTAKDAFGNVATQFNGPVTLALSGGASGAVLSGTLTANAVAGVATFTGLIINAAGTGYAIAATNPSVGTTTSTTFAVTPGPAAKVVFTANAANVVAGQPMSPLTVSVRDASDNVVTTFAGALTIAIGNNPGGSTLSGTATATASGGTATFTGLSLNKTGAGYTLVVSGAALTSATSAAFAVTPGAPASLVVTSGDNQSGPATTTLPLPVTARVTDALGNVIPGVAVVGTVTAGGGSVGRGNTTTDASGFALFDWTLGANPGANQLTITAGSLTALANATATAAPNTASKLVVTGQPAGGTAGAGIGTVTVQAQTSTNALATGFTGNVTISIGANPGGSTLSGTVTVAAVAGVATFTNLSLNKTGTGYTLVASSNPLTQGTSATFAITPGPVASAAFTVHPPNGFVNTPLSPAPQVTVFDSLGNIATNYTGLVSVSLAANPGDASLTGTTSVGAINGVATFANIQVSQIASGYTLQANAGPVAFSNAFDITSPINSWTNASGGNWSTAASWSLGHVPTATEDVRIVAAGSYTVLLDVDATMATLQLGGPSGTQTLNTSDFILSTSTAATINANGVLLVAAGGIVNGGGTLSNAGTLTLNGGTISNPLNNQGLLNASGTSALNAGFTTNAGSTLRIGQIDGSASVAQLTVAAGFTNSGAIELTTQFPQAYAARLVITSGAVVNAVGATISSLPGQTAGGARQFTARLINLGTVTVSTPLTLDAANELHGNSGTIDATAANITITGNSSLVNSGTITVGNTFTISGGSLTHQTGATLSGAGTLALVNTTATFTPTPAINAITCTNSTMAMSSPITTASTGLTFSSCTVNGGPTITNAAGKTINTQGTIFNSPVDNAGAIVASATNSFGAYTSQPGSMLRIGQVDGSTSLAQTTISSGFTNNGTIDLTTSFAQAYSAQLTVSSGILVNSSSGTIEATPGALAGGSRTLVATLQNAGLVAAATNFTINGVGAAHINTGTFQLASGNITVNQSGVSPSFTNSTGLILISAGQTFTVSGGTFTHGASGSLVGPGTVSIVNGSATFTGAHSISNIAASNASLSFAQAQTTQTTTYSFVSSTVSGAGAFTNAAGQTMAINSSIITNAFTNNGTLTSTGSSQLGGALTTGAGSTIRIGQTDGSQSTALLTVASGFTNNGTIELTTSFAQAYSAQLTLSTGTLVNSSTGTISTTDGLLAGGSRTIAGNVNNQGVITVGPGTAGQLQIQGNFTNTGTVNLELGGVTAGTQYDRISVVGNATLGGTLNVTLINSFTPASSSNFVVLTTTGAVSGTFATTNLPASITSPPTYNAANVTLIAP